MNRTIILLAMALSATPVAAAPVERQLARPDGSLIHYTLDRPENPVGLLVLSQGSGCAPGVKSPALATVRAAFSAYTTLIVEKVGITPDMPEEQSGETCPQAFLDHYTVSQRIEDYRTVLAALGPRPDRLVLFGGSEGGLAMVMLAQHVAPDATILLSTAAGTAFGDMVLSTVPSEGKPDVAAGFEAARANPDSGELLGGHTYRFWADSLDIRAVDHMRETSTPFLLIQGGLDTSAPVASARATADTFAAGTRCNLTYWEFPALDHRMADPKGALHLSDVATLAATWVEHPIPAC